MTILNDLDKQDASVTSERLKRVKELEVIKARVYNALWWMDRWLAPSDADSDKQDLLERPNIKITWILEKRLIGRFLAGGVGSSSNAIKKALWLDDYDQYSTYFSLDGDKKDKKLIFPLKIVSYRGYFDLPNIWIVKDDLIREITVDKEWNIVWLFWHDILKYRKNIGLPEDFKISWEVEIRGIEYNSDWTVKIIKYFVPDNNTISMNLWWGDLKNIKKAIIFQVEFEQW